MEIREVKDENIWNEFIFSFENSQFLQSWQWAEFQKILGRKIFRLGLFENEKILAVALLIKMPLPFLKSYLYCPRGPIFKENNEKVTKIFLEKIKEIGKKEKSIFLRFEPLNQLPNYQLQKVKDVQPSKTILLDLTKSEDEILEEMHPKTRYNIRLAEKRGVRVKISQSDEEIEIFLKILEKTAKRDKFKPHPPFYYRKLLKFDKNFIKLFLAEYQEKIIAGNLMVFFNDTVTYLHGASDNQFRNVMAPYLLHWIAIKEAKRLCFKYYDFWGVDEKKWPGVTRFKKGFVSSKTGIEISYPGTFDLAFNKLWYRLYILGKKFL
jgi:lipid II:glycine glycyltransferase (peptidoglycan interpeptide bridge formation enzyme)